MLYKERNSRPLPMRRLLSANTVLVLIALLLVEGTLALVCHPHDSLEAAT
jgi:hypothetical protein